MFGQDRTQLRQIFFSAWHKFRHEEKLEPLEQVIVNIIQLHPEYHTFLEDEETNIERDYLPEMGETNPFLHMSMHIAIQEQLSTQRPAEILDIYQQLLKKFHDPHEVEHKIMDCLAEMIWKAQRDNQQPDEKHYLECLKKLL